MMWKTTQKMVEDSLRFARDLRAGGINQSGVQPFVVSDAVLAWHAKAQRCEAIARRVCVEHGIDPFAPDPRQTWTTIGGPARIYQRYARLAMSVLDGMPPLAIDVW